MNAENPMSALRKTPKQNQDYPADPFNTGRRHNQELGKRIEAKKEQERESRFNNNKGKAAWDDDKFWRWAEGKGSSEIDIRRNQIRRDWEMKNNNKPVAPRPGAFAQARQSNSSAQKFDSLNYTLS